MRRKSDSQSLESGWKFAVLHASWPHVPGVAVRWGGGEGPTSGFLEGGGVLPGSYFDTNCDDGFVGDLNTEVTPSSHIF